MDSTPCIYNPPTTTITIFMTPHFQIQKNSVCEKISQLIRIPSVCFLNENKVQILQQQYPYFPSYANLLHLSPQSVSPNQAPNSIHSQLQIIQRVPWHHLLVQVTIECHLLDVLVGAHLHKCLPRRVRSVKDLLKHIQHLVRRPVGLVPFF
ncbi:hypothetical protein RHGRI_034824 [Rhododendron griersonianum]|uniref:Uncharacterized protein n=1 Tax=Rhododendron griersonianum TaxID=479676 RepID=A0AAV6I620_9ERIC|nr:hypothetical protein RHGRI_034824 [Rhododendron griersonianum]